MRDSFLQYFLKNMIFPLLCVVFAIAFYVSAHELKPIQFNYPKGIMAVLAVLIIWTVFDEVKKWLQTKEENVSGTASFILSLIKDWKKPLTMLIVLIGYILIIRHVGFYASTTVFLILQFLLLGIHRPLTFVLNLIGLLAFCYLLFDVILMLPLPSGFLM